MKNLPHVTATLRDIDDWCRENNVQFIVGGPNGDGNWVVKKVIVDGLTRVMNMSGPDLEQLIPAALTRAYEIKEETDKLNAGIKEAMHGTS